MVRYGAHRICDNLGFAARARAGTKCSGNSSIANGFAERQVTLVLTVCAETLSL